MFLCVSFLLLCYVFLIDRSLFHRLCSACSTNNIIWNQCITSLAILGTFLLLGVYCKGSIGEIKWNRDIVSGLAYHLCKSVRAWSWVNSFDFMHLFRFSQLDHSGTSWWFLTSAWAWLVEGHQTMTSSYPRVRCSSMFVRCRPVVSPSFLFFSLLFFRRTFFLPLSSMISSCS